MTKTHETRTKIVATLGPASWDEDVLTELMQAGIDVARINCSHSDHDAIRRQVSRVRRVAMRLDQPVAILLDLQGPKIRIGKVDGALELAAGDILTVVMDSELIGQGHRVGTTYPEMAADVRSGDRVLFADGALSGEVAEVRHASGEPSEVDIRIHDGGVLTSNKGINLPGVDMSVPALTEKDIADAAVGVEVGVDYIALSFVRRAADVQALRSVLAGHGQDIPIIAKIEKPEGVEHLAEILDHVAGVMVARGDLGVEVNIERVPVYQKHIIQSAFRRGRLVITATQMLDSMERNPRPTRAETTDVANAILDGTDAVMLSGETSVGKYPIQAVRMMDSIAREVEKSPFFQSTPLEHLPPLEGPGGAVWRAACFAVQEANRPLVVFTWSGASAIFASRARPGVPIFALTSEQRVVDRLSLVWGVTPILVPRVESTDDLIALGEQTLLTGGYLERGQEIVVLAGRSPKRGASNLLKVYRIGGDESGSVLEGLAAP